jgi:hypothetical protein
VSLFRRKTIAPVINTTIVRPNPNEEREARLGGSRALIAYSVNNFLDAIEDLTEAANDAEDVAAEAVEERDVLLKLEAEALEEAERARLIAGRLRALVGVPA